MMGILKVLAGAAILLAVIVIYVAVSYMHDKKMGKKTGCDGNCSGCGMHSDACGEEAGQR